MHFKITSGDFRIMKKNPPENQACGHTEGLWMRCKRLKCMLCCCTSSFKYCKVTNFYTVLNFILSYFWKKCEIQCQMKIYFCLEAIEFQCNFVLRPSKVRKLVRTNQFQAKSTKMGTGRKFVTLQYWVYKLDVALRSCRRAFTSSTFKSWTTLASPHFGIN